MVDLDCVEREYIKLSRKLLESQSTLHPDIQFAKNLLFDKFSNLGLVYIDFTRIRKARKAGILPKRLQYLRPGTELIHARLIIPETCGSSDEDIALLERCDADYKLEQVVANQKNFLGPFPIMISRCHPEITKVPDHAVRTKPLPTHPIEDKDKLPYQIFLRQLGTRFLNLP